MHYGSVCLLDLQMELVCFLPVSVSFAFAVFTSTLGQCKQGVLYLHLTFAFF